MKITDLSKQEQALVHMALRARLKAQAPYSNFLVGAAVLGEGQMMRSGCNVERANYASGSHAEQVAVDGLVADHGPTKIIAIAVIGAMKGENPSLPVWPCGHCRQIIWENSGGNPDVRIIAYRGGDEVDTATIGELFPKPFGPLDLGIDVFKSG